MGRRWIKREVKGEGVGTNFYLEPFLNIDAGIRDMKTGKAMTSHVEGDCFASDADEGVIAPYVGSLHQG